MSSLYTHLQIRAGFLVIALVPLIITYLLEVYASLPARNSLGLKAPFWVQAVNLILAIWSWWNGRLKRPK